MLYIWVYRSQSARPAINHTTRRRQVPPSHQRGPRRRVYPYRDAGRCFTGDGIRTSTIEHPVQNIQLNEK